jgi:hypothetical protein
VLRPNNELIANVTTIASASYSNNCLSECWIRASFQVSVSSGSLNGVFTVQGSNDLAQGSPPNQFSPTYWNNLGSVSCSISSGTSVWIPYNGPQGTINYFETCARYHRVQFAATVGSGNLAAALGVYNIRAETRSL